MGRRARVLVGVLYSGELQVTHCLRSLIGQSGVDLGYFVVAHRSKVDAHNLLYRFFETHGGHYDALIKLDADMVISASSFAFDAVEALRLEQTKTQLIVPVWDYFTDRPLVGLHVYRPGMRWSTRMEPLFTDANGLAANESKVLRSFAPQAILHAKHPTPFQAFHFGAHRGLKLRAALDDGRSAYARSHLRNLLRIRQLAAQTPDSPRSLAYLGFVLALRGDFENETVSYTDPTLEDYFFNDPTLSIPKMAYRSATQVWTSLRLRDIHLSIVVGQVVVGDIVRRARPRSQDT